MEQFVEELNSGRQMLATYKDRLSLLRSMNAPEPIVTSDAEDAVTELDGLNKARKTLVKKNAELKMN